MKEKWITTTEWMDIDTGEIIHESQYSKYRIIQTEKLKTEYGKKYNIKRYRIYAKEKEQLVLPLQGGQK